MDFLFYNPGFGVADSPGGIPFVNSSPHLSPPCSLSGLWDTDKDGYVS